MRIPDNNSVIDELLHGSDEVVFNIISLIRRQDGARLYSDTRSYLTAQTNAFCPLWIYVNENADGQTERALFAILSEAMKENVRLAINAQEGCAENVLSLFAQQQGLNFSKNRKLNAYSIHKVREVPSVGHMLMSNEKYIQDIAMLIQQMMIDDDDGEMNDEEAMRLQLLNCFE